MKTKQALLDTYTIQWRILWDAGMHALVKAVASSTCADSIAAHSSGSGIHCVQDVVLADGRWQKLELCPTWVQLLYRLLPVMIMSCEPVAARGGAS